MLILGNSQNQMWTNSVFLFFRELCGECLDDIFWFAESVTDLKGGVEVTPLVAWVLEVPHCLLFFQNEEACTVRLRYWRKLSENSRYLLLGITTNDSFSPHLGTEQHQDPETEATECSSANINTIYTRHVPTLTFHEKVYPSQRHKASDCDRQIQSFLQPVLPEFYPDVHSQLLSSM